MNLKFKYFLLIITLHAILVVLTFLLLEENKLYFILSEVLILLSLYLSYKLYEQLIRPLDLLQSGTSALMEADYTVKYLETGSREMDKLVAVFNAMIDRLREERTSMTEQSYFVRNLIDVSPIGIIIMDYDGNLSNINPSASKILSITNDWKGQALDKWEHDLMPTILNLESGASKLVSYNGINKYRIQANDVIHQGFKRRFILIEDLSFEFLQSEKEAYGRVIRMMAHEVNNSMGAVNSILNTVIEFGFDDEDSDPELKESLEIAASRNSNLAEFMDNYAEIIRLPQPNFQNVVLQDILKRCGQVFESQAKKQDVSISYDFPPEDILVKLDPNQIEQAISNMLTNALEAIVSDGDIIISCQSSPKSFSIIDNGVGISSQNTPHLFTPFFSTKPTGQGIGLMLIRDILQNHKAKFSLSTDPSTKLTSFKVDF